MLHSGSLEHIHLVLLNDSELRGQQLMISVAFPTSILQHQSSYSYSTREEWKKGWHQQNHNLVSGK